MSPFLYFWDSFYALKREAAPGVDGMTWKEYETDLDKRLEDLHSRVDRGAYSSATFQVTQSNHRQQIGTIGMVDLSRINL